VADDIGPFSTATQMLAALDAGTVSSVELVDQHLARIDAHDAVLNAVPVRTPERALEAARAADDARSAGGRRGALLGLPITLKESTQTAGLPQSAGIEAFRDHRPVTDGPLARAVFDAGACLLGKTNIPSALADWQADSPVYGRTVNPWDHDRTPGGSTGGGAAALAAGLTPLEVGSDIGGSIRVPAAYCGVYGHRPSESAVPRAGAFPLDDAPNPAQLMGVQGPLARSAADLELLFDVIAGPVDGEAAGWRLDLPAARHERFADFRVAVMPPLTLAQPSNEMRGAVDELASFLVGAGATVAEAMPEVDQTAYFHDYLMLLTTMTTQGRARDDRERMARRFLDGGDPILVAQAPGLTLDAHQYLGLLRRRESARAAWRAFFRDWDVLVCPTALDVAFPHQTDPPNDRVLHVDDEVVPYWNNLVYPMWAIFAGQPATAFPAGRSSAGLPLGLQAIGPYLEDRTTLRFAQLLEREWRSFEHPPGY
jgi:amidase